MQPFGAPCNSPASGELSYLLLAVSQDHAGVQLRVAWQLRPPCQWGGRSGGSWCLSFALAEPHVGSTQPWQSLVSGEPQGDTLCCLMGLSQLPPPGCPCVVSSLATIPRPPTPQSRWGAAPGSLIPLKNAGSAGLAGNSPGFVFTVCEWLGVDTCPV